jgi:hypothetical protein
MSELFDNFKETVHLIRAKRKELSQSIQGVLSEFLLTHPEVQKICWVQYSPYFNDGEPCVFNVHEFNFYFTDELVDEDEEGEEGYGHELPGGYKDPYALECWNKHHLCSQDTFNDCKKLEWAMHQVEDVMEDTFGSDVLVVVTREGIEVQEYEHD